MRSIAKLALLVGTSAPLLLLSASALAAGQDPPAAAPPAAAPPTTAPPAAAAPTPPPEMTAPPPAPTPPAATPPAATPPATLTPPSAPPPAASVAAAAGAFVASAPGADGTVQVHIATKELVTLEHRSPGGAWQRVCETPCDARVPGGDEFRIVGEGINDSQPFSLTTPKGDVVKIHVAPGIKRKAKIGEYMTFTGAVLFVGALVVGIGAADPGSTFQANGSTNNYNWDVIAVGTAIGVVGAVSTILGGAWWYDNSQTRVAGDVQGDQPARGGLEPRYQTGLRVSAPAAPMYSAPILSATF